MTISFELSNMVIFFRNISYSIYKIRNSRILRLGLVSEVRAPYLKKTMFGDLYHFALIVGKGKKYTDPDLKFKTHIEHNLFHR